MSFSTGKGKPRRETNALSESSDSDCVYSSFGIWEEENHPYAANMSIKDKVEMSARRFQNPRYPVETDSMSELTDGEETDPEAGEEEPLMTNQGVDVVTPVRGKKKEKPLWDSMEAGDGENATLLDGWGYTPSPDDTPVRPGIQTSSYQGRQSDEHLPNLVVIEGIDVQPLSSIRGSNSQLQTGISKVDPNSSAEPDPVQQGARSEAREDVKHQHHGTAAELLSSKEWASEEEMHEGQWAADTSEGIWYRPVQMTAESTIQPSCIPKQDKLATQNTTIDDLLAHKEIELDISCSDLSQDTERKSDLVGPYNQQPYGMDEHVDRIGVNQSRKSHTSHKFSIEMPHAKTLHTENEATEPENVQESIGAVKEMRDATGKSLPAAHDTFTTAIPAFEASQKVLQSSEKVQVAAEDIFPYDKHADQASEGFPRHAQKNDAAADELVPSEVVEEDIAADEPVPSEVVEEDVAAEVAAEEVVEEHAATDELTLSEAVSVAAPEEEAAEEAVEQHAATDEAVPAEAVDVAVPEEEAAEEAVEPHAAADEAVPSEAVDVAVPAEVAAEEAVEPHAAADEAVPSEAVSVAAPAEVAAEEAVEQHAATDEAVPSEAVDVAVPAEVAAEEAVEPHAAADEAVPSEAVSVAAPAEVAAEEAVEQHAATDEAVPSEVLDVTVPAEEAAAEHAARDEPVPCEVVDEDIAADEPVPSEVVEEDIAADEPVPSEVVEEDIAADEPVPSEVVEEDVAAEVAAEEVVEEHAATDELTLSEAVSVAAPEEKAAEEAVEQHAATDEAVPAEVMDEDVAADELVPSEAVSVAGPALVAAEEAVEQHAAADEPLPSEVPDGEAIDEVAADGLDLGDAGAPQLASRVETGGVPGASFVLLEANVSGNQETDLSRNTEPHSIEGEVTFERPDIDEFPTHNPDVEKKSSSAQDATQVNASTAESISVHEAEPRRKPRKQISGRIAQAIASLGAEPAKGLELSIEGKQDRFDTASIRVNDSKVGRTKLRNFTACDISTESKSGSSKREGSGRMAKEKENHRETSPRAKNVSPKMVDGIARWQSCLNAHSSQDQPISVDKNIRALSPTTSSVNRNVNQQTTQLSPTCQKDHHKCKPVKSPSKENVQPASLEKHKFKEARIELDPIPYEKLKKMKAGSGIDTTKKELYLSDDDFYKVFQCSRTAFSAMKSWRQAAEKKKVGLF